MALGKIVQNTVEPSGECLGGADKHQPMVRRSEKKTGVQGRGTRPQPGSPVVVFDGDDTLWPNQVHYDQAIRQFSDLMRQNGFPGKAAIAIFERIDRGNVARFGYSKRRFPTSMEDAYRSMCRERKQKPKRDVLVRTRNIGRSVFTRRLKLNAGALGALTELALRFRLILFTAGDVAIQRQKVQSLGLRRYFDRIVVVPVKTTDEFRKLLKCERVAPERVIMVGNSLRSDIRPALEAGIMAVLYLARTWHYENAVMIDRSIPKVRSLSRLPLIVSRLVRNGESNERE